MSSSPPGSKSKRENRNAEGSREHQCLRMGRKEQSGGRGETGEQVSWRAEEERVSRREQLLIPLHANYDSREVVLLARSAEIYLSRCLTIIPSDSKCEKNGHLHTLWVTDNR